MGRYEIATGEKVVQSAKNGNLIATFDRGDLVNQAMTVLENLPLEPMEIYRLRMLYEGIVRGGALDPTKFAYNNNGQLIRR